jgi:Mg/Co/Ni transporter MgtE
MASAIYYVYVLDRERRLIGFVSLRELILAKPAMIVCDLMHRDPVFARVDDDREHVARELARYNFLAMPLVHEQDRLVGIVTHDDVIDVVIEEATEDALRMAAVGALEESHLDARFPSDRAVWCVARTLLIPGNANLPWERRRASGITLVLRTIAMQISALSAASCRLPARLY